MPLKEEDLFPDKFAEKVKKKPDPPPEIQIYTPKGMPDIQVHIPEAAHAEAAEQGLSFSEWLRQKSLEEFIYLFGHIWDQGKGEYVPWVLWPMQVELCAILDSAKIIWIPKARQVGGSELVAMKAVKTALEEERSETIIVSKGEIEAKYFLKTRVQTKLENIRTGTGLGVPWPSWEFFTQTAVFGNGAKIDSLASDPDAGRGRTVRLVVMDEAKTIEHAAEIWKALRPTIDKNPRGQMIVLSNSGNGTWFNDMTRRIYDGKVKGLTMFFLSSWADPSRDQAWKETMLSQFSSDVEFYSEFPEIIEHIFLSPEGRVIPSFDDTLEGRHVKEFDAEALRLSGGMDYIILYDHGYNHPARFLECLYDHFDNHLYVFDELNWEKTHVHVIGKDIKERMDKRLWTPRYRIADTAIFSKTGQEKSVADILREESGVSFSKSYKYDEEAGLQAVNRRFSRNRITIHPRCRSTRSDLSKWIYDKHGKPRDADNESPDLLRYLEAQLNKQERPPEEPKPKAYQSRKMKAHRSFWGEGAVPDDAKDWMAY